jgi:DNA-binding transcriptional MocR family regulator
VGPSRVANAALVLKRATDLASSVPLQAAVAHFCRTGAYDRHLRRVAKELARRLDRACAALEAHLPDGSSFTRPDGGFAIWVTFPADIDTAALLAAAKRAGVVYSPGAIFYTDGRRSSSLRLSIGQTAAEDIERGVRVLCEAAAAAMPRGGGRERHAGRAAPAVHV